MFEGNERRSVWLECRQHWPGQGLESRKKTDDGLGRS